MWSRSRLSPRTSWRLKAPRIRSVASISQSTLRATRSARTVSTLRSTPDRVVALRCTRPGRVGSPTESAIVDGRYLLPDRQPMFLMPETDNLYQPFEIMRGHCHSSKGRVKAFRGGRAMYEDGNQE